MNFDNLITRQEELLTYMQESGYAGTYINRYRTVIRQISSCEKNTSWNSYQDVYDWYSQNYSSPTYLHEIRAILGKLELFDCHGIFPDNKASKSSFWLSRPSYTDLNAGYQELVDIFCRGELNRGIKERDVKNTSAKISSFLLDLQNEGAATLADVTQKMVISCFMKNGDQIRCGSVAARIRYFFKTHAEAGNKDAALVLTYIPQLRIYRKNIDYLTDDEISRIEATIIEPDNGLSLKDRAIVTLLLNTGLRGIDVAALELSSIDWLHDEIRLAQQKTGKLLILPLTAAIGNAIYDYCINERPASELPFVFLSAQGPHGKLTTDGIAYSVAKVMHTAGIRQEKGRRIGTHIFRHHLATSMLGNGIPQPVITGTLGHSSPVSLTSYLYADMKHLKECALSIEPYAMDGEVFSYV